MTVRLPPIYCTTSLLLLYIFLLHPARSGAQATSGLPTVRVAIEPAYDSVSGLHRFLFGQGYRKLWAAPVPLKVFDMDKVKGGLQVTRLGGGNQTKSLRLQDASGKEYVLRSIQKYPERGLPPQLRQTIARDILQDQVITSHPFAALTVPPLAEALDVPHTNPQIVFFPDHPALADSLKPDFANTVLLFEEREPVDSFETDATDKVQRNLESDNDYTIDQKKMLTARLLDLLLGDWDRHEDQWRWKKIKDDNEVTYVPIPRDRDKVFYHTTGLLPKMLSRQWLKGNLQGFNKGIKDIGTYNYNNRYFDRYFLNRLDKKDWQQAIDQVQTTLTDSVIEAAVRQMPDTIFRLSGQPIIHTLTARRNRMDKYAMEYYRFLARHTDVLASDKRELVQVTYLPHGKVAVEIRKIKKDSTLGQQLYSREFEPGDTREVRIYARGGNDVVQVSGGETSPIKVRILGGSHNDVYTVDQNVQNVRRLYIYDQANEPNRFENASRAKLRLGKQAGVDAFDRTYFEYDEKRVTGSAFFNPDQGFLLRAGFIVKQQGFRKPEFASRHLFFINYATYWKSMALTYSGRFNHLFGKNDLTIDVLSRGPGNVDNFFGVGNETVFNNTGRKARRFFQNKYDYLRADARIHRQLSTHSAISVGPAFEYYHSSLQSNTGKFLVNYNAMHPNEAVFSNQLFAGMGTMFRYNSREESLMPDEGIFLDFDARAMMGLNGQKNNYQRLFTSLSFYIPIKEAAIVLANRTGLGTSFGNPAFYQQHKLGGPVNLRGYNLNRFTGRSVAYNNLELRMKLFDFTSYLTPGSVGVVGFVDAGRVWAPGERSNTWHTGTGGGLYIVPADLVVVQGLAAFSPEGTFGYFSLGFRF